MLNAIMFIIAFFFVVAIFRLINKPVEGDTAETHFRYKQQLKSKATKL